MKRLVEIVLMVIMIICCLTILKSCKKVSEPAVTTNSVTNITSTSANSGGNVTNNGGAQVTARGVCWSTSQNPTVSLDKTNNGKGNGSFDSNITGLTANTKYYVRAYATNSEGIGYGNEVTFVTLPPIMVPSVTTSSISSVTPTTAVSGGTITNDGGGDIIARGVCWNTTGNPNLTDTQISSGTGTGSYSSNLTGLIGGTIYYVRAYATNDAGTAYGNEVNFITPVSDKEGNVYKTVKIGTQVWMAENLKTTEYRDGSSISMITDETEWANRTTEAFCWYGNDDATYKNTYGALYNWYAVNTGELCPAGWHVPTDAEWIQLEMFLGMPYDIAQQTYWRGTDEGTKLKSTTGWYMNGNGTDDFGFNALPAGMRYNDGSFRYVGNWTDFWSSTGINTTDAWSRALGYSNTNIGRYDDIKTFGFCIRCVKN